MMEGGSEDIDGGGAMEPKGGLHRSAEVPA